MRSKLYIGGLPENSGPGNILGAITDQVEIDGEDVGNIDIKGSVATVSLSEEVAGEVAEQLDNVSGETVSVREADSGERDVHFLELARLVEIEREEEMRRHEEEIKRLSGHEREKEGRAILHLKGKDEGTGLGGKDLIKFARQRQGEELPESEISVGDLVMLSKKDPLRDDNPTGTVARKTNYSITVAFDNKPPGFLYGKGIRCDLYVNDITYQRQLDALSKADEAEDSRLGELVDKSLRIEEVEFGDTPGDLEFLNENLNPSQREAVERAMAAEDFFLIHGPPGTGKTVTSVEIARQLVRNGNKVLCTADSNTAVDNLVEWLADRGEKVVRIGHPVRVTPTLRSHTLDEIVQQNEKYQKSRELREKAMDLVDKQDELTHPGGRWRRGMSDEKIKSLARKGKGSRGVSPSRIKEMASWLEIQEKIDELFERVERFEKKAVDEIIEWADGVCATNSGCGSELMSDRHFDALVIDEATQSTEPSCWIPITLSDKVIMAGDHKQLPPTILSEKAQELNKTLFESLVERFDEVIRSVLKVQYRMHESIMNFSNREFYDGVLEADSSVADHTLEDLIEREVDSHSDNISEVAIAPDPPVVFLDTSAIEAEERTRKGSTSKENPKEAKLVSSLASKLLEMGLDPTDVAVITPYDDQVDLIGRKIDLEDLEIDTVDGFQGREKEVVLLSLVRSNEENNVGFLEDVRRLNVSLTRAKRKLIIVGDSSTIGAHETYSNLLGYISRNGKILEL
ncbi:hypothetical protein AKJ63_00135 [candidate division MSBL1 archaeon SCGC-AAA259D18]|uniref:DNA helicase n=1 Tax=candidate division MSBL1 archaeon SCGC-AAA259D18 TaxID=1698262 RepID=A0A133UCU6_9EURY|nr:hypothetical protein AKJ63_00135 [candidate division MSBL1 archaeon SCGC-AAA259D18]